MGHDFYEGERVGPKGFPRFTDPRLRGPGEYASYLRMATEHSLERIGIERFDLLLLHNPDRTGYTDPAVWEGMAALRDDGLTRLIGVAPGPANGFTLDLIACFERFGELIDWAMVILSPMEPWPGELVLPAAERFGIDVITRVVDHGGVFHGDVREQALPEFDHRRFRPPGWVAAAEEKLVRMRPVAEAHGMTSLQLACSWNLAHAPVKTVVPTLIQEPYAGARPIEEQRAELAVVPEPSPLSDDDVATVRAAGDNTGCMKLKGAAPDHEGEPRPDRWPLDEDLLELARRWDIDPARDLGPVAV
jgi:aryl-alcohol dehydrogenase-like predicted oxidoreductase